jgi:hypothetical protein
MDLHELLGAVMSAYRDTKVQTIDLMMMNLMRRKMMRRGTSEMAAVSLIRDLDA